MNEKVVGFNCNMCGEKSSDHTCIGCGLDKDNIATLLEILPEVFSSLQDMFPTWEGYGAVYEHEPEIV